MAKSEVQVGDTVFYFENGITTVPQVAIVVSVFSDFLVSLTVYEGQRWTPKNSIHNKFCEAVVKNPVIAANAGVWDHRPSKEEIASAKAKEANSRATITATSASSPQTQPEKTAAGPTQTRQTVAKSA